MKNTISLRSLSLGLLLFVSLIGLYASTFSSSLMFDDAAEFALVIRQGSIAHSPGFPSYILSGMFWDRLTQGLFSDTVFRLNMLAAVSVAAACVLFYFALRSLVRQLSEGVMGWREELSALFPALVFGIGNTTWAWANTIEVYSFQVFAMGLLLFGLLGYQESRSTIRLIVAAVGLALGWSNHHLTMIAFTPFVPFFFFDRLFSRPVIEKKRSQSTAKAVGWWRRYLDAVLSKDFLIFTAASASVTLGFYGWMMWRAQQDYFFMFGKPENLDLMFYHIRGGAYTKNITETSAEISSSRLPYFLTLTLRQFLWFTPLVLTGLYQALKSKAHLFVSLLLAYFLILLFYQLRNNQWSSTDAYMLLPFMTLSMLMVFPILAFFRRFRLAVVIPLLAVVTVLMGFKEHDRSSYPVSKDLMRLLDKSSPKNSVVVLSDWTTIIQYMFYRYEYGFRTDLDVMHYDFKFCHYLMFPKNYPILYGQVRQEYDRYIEELRKDQPYNVANTGCDLSNPQVKKAFQDLLLKIESVCKSGNRPFLTDPRSHYTYATERLYEPGRYVCGCFSSATLCDSSYSKEFLDMEFEFLKSPLLLNDPSCLDKMVDFQAMLDQHISFYTANNFTAQLQTATNAKEKVMRTQRDLKRSMSFAYKVK